VNVPPVTPTAYRVPGLHVTLSIASAGHDPT
jgi:hypothetical protein